MESAGAVTVTSLLRFSELQVGQCQDVVLNIIT
jgi:hypothetical protein